MVIWQLTDIQTGRSLSNGSPTPKNTSYGKGPALLLLRSPACTLDYFHPWDFSTRFCCASVPCWEPQLCTMGVPGWQSSITWSCAIWHRHYACMHANIQWGNPESTAAPSTMLNRSLCMSAWWSKQHSVPHANRRPTVLDLGPDLDLDPNLGSCGQAVVKSAYSWKYGFVVKNHGPTTTDKEFTEDSPCQC